MSFYKPLGLVTVKLRVGKFLQIWQIEAWRPDGAGDSRLSSAIVFPSSPLALLSLLLRIIEHLKVEVKEFNEFEIRAQL